MNQSITRYESIEDVSPHTENIVLLKSPETDSFDETSFREIFDEIVEDVQNLPGDELDAVAHYDGFERRNKHTDLLPHSVWVVHQSVLSSGEKSEDILADIKRAVPNTTQVYFCVDADVADLELNIDVESLELELPFSKQVSSADRLIVELLAYFSIVNPRLRAGKKYIKQWNNEVCDYLETHGHT